jgi:hypothetical protein
MKRRRGQTHIPLRRYVPLVSPRSLSDHVLCAKLMSERRKLLDFVVLIGYLYIGERGNHSLASTALYVVLKEQWLAR